MIRKVMGILVLLCCQGANSWAGDQTPFDVATALREQVAKSLTPDLALVSVQLPTRRACKRAKSVSIHWRRAPRVGRASVQILLTGRAGRVCRSWARLEIARLRPVLVASRELVAGTLIAPGDIVQERRAAARDQGIAAASSSLLGLKVIETIEAGAIVAEEQLVMRPPVARGTLVKVLVHRGLLVVSRVGTLDRRSKIGELTRARVSGVKIPIAGRLVDASTLVVEGSLP